MRDALRLAKIKTDLLRTTMVVIGILGTLGFSLLGPLTVHAATPTATLQGNYPKVSFTFDDGLTSALTQAEPTLAKYGLTGTDYVISGCVGMTTAPNTCNANQDRTYMTWAQIKQLQTDGWEVGSHTVDHDCLASSGQTDPSDCANPAPLTNAQLTTELSGSQSAIATNTGTTPVDFAPPYGDYNNNVIAQIAKNYQSMRQFKNASNNANVWPYSDYYLQDYVVQEGLTPVSTVETAINNAITNKQWLILTFHDIATTPSKNADDYQYGTSELAQLAAYVQTKVNASQLASVSVNQGLITSSTNMLPNGNLAAGLTGGWTTDAPATITADSGNNGSYPNATNSVKIASAATAGHLFSPTVSVTPGTTYLEKSFLNLQTITSGQVGYYIDEYDANGNWISGQWKTQETSPFVEDMNFTYTPSSASVSKARVQVIVAANSGITGYVDNFQMFPVTTTTTAPTNMMPNGGFSAGISGGWTTDDPTNITADSAGNGIPSNPTYSVSLKSGTRANNGHLFSPQIAVSSTHSYTVSNWLNLKQIGTTSGAEVGYYVDEYNASGAWISGKYLGGVHSTGANTVGFTYTPSSTSVAKASLQVIVISNAGIQAYLANVVWTQN